MNYELVEEWSVMLLYMLCSGLAFWRFKSSRSRAVAHADFWLALSIALCVMGVNKVADFQTPLIGTLKAIVAYFSLESSKPTLRFALFGCLGLVASTLALIAVGRYHKPLRANLGLLLGLTSLLVFYLIRTTSIAGIAIRANYWFNNWPLEVASLIVIATFTCSRFNGSTEGHQD